MIGGHSMFRSAARRAHSRNLLGVKIAAAPCVQCSDGARAIEEVARLMRADGRMHDVMTHKEAETPLSLYHLLDPEVLADPYPLYRAPP